MRPIVTAVVWSVCLSVCLSVGAVLIRPNGYRLCSESGLVGAKEPRVMRGQDPAEEMSILGVMLGHAQTCPRSIFSALFDLFYGLF